MIEKIHRKDRAAYLLALKLPWRLDPDFILKMIQDARLEACEAISMIFSAHKYFVMPLRAAWSYVFSECIAASLASISRFCSLRPPFFFIDDAIYAE